MFINHLFDMSEVETVIVCDDTEILPSKPESNELLSQAMTMIMESYINTAMAIALNPPPRSADSSEQIERSTSTEYSEYSFLSDAIDADIGRDIAFYIHDADDINGNINLEAEVSHIVPAVQITEVSTHCPSR